MIDDLQSQEKDPARQIRPGLGVKLMEGFDGIYEMRWSYNGRATFEYGKEVRPGLRHIIWRRVGYHDILNQP